MRRGLMAATLALAIFGLGAEGVMAKTVPASLVANLKQESSIGAYRNTVAWSAYDEQIKSFRLMVARDGIVETLPVTTSANGFQVDVGPGNNGTPVLVYRRCVSGSNCAFFTLDLETRLERRLPLRVDRSDVQPSIWRNRIGFIETRKRSDRVWSLDLRSPGRREQVALPYPGMGAQPTELDVSATHAAMVVDYFGFDCSHDVRSTVVLAGKGRPRVLAAVCPGEDGQAWIGATLDASRLYFSQSCCLRGGVYRFDLDSGSYWWGAKIEADSLFYARGGRTNYAVFECYAVECSEDEYKLVRFGDSRFKRVTKRFVYRPATF